MYYPRRPAAVAFVLIILLAAGPSPAAGPPASQPAAATADAYPVGAPIEAAIANRWWDATVLARDGQQRIQVRNAADNTTAWLMLADVRPRGASPEVAARLSKET